MATIRAPLPAQSRTQGPHVIPVEADYEGFTWKATGPMTPFTRESHITFNRRPLWRTLTGFGWLMVFICGVAMGSIAALLNFLCVRFGR